MQGTAQIIAEPINSVVKQVDIAIQTVPGLKKTSIAVARALHNAILSSETSRTAADLLHGTWIGHPLHPILTDVTIGAWTFAGMFDAFSILNQADHIRRTADTLVAIGTLSAIPTALAGITDYSGIKQDAAGHAALHALLNTSALVLFFGSWRARDTERRGLGITLSTLALGLATISAWIGGELVYRLRVGVNHSKHTSKPDEWTPVMAADDLHEHDRVRVEVDDVPVLLYRYGGTIYAINAVCSHAGGPLEEGTFEGHCVQCPWHDSVYDLRDGSVVHGPSTFGQPHYKTRIQDGQIEIRFDEN
jgi:nitrite reductase/ring-hydroxylating ferredoxin subunit/uncharacterized membrane protein